MQPKHRGTRLCIAIAIAAVARAPQDPQPAPALPPQPSVVSSRGEIEALPADAQHVVGVGIEDDEIPALLRLRKLETLELRAVVPSPIAPDKPAVPMLTVSDDGLLRLASMKSLRNVILVHQLGLTARGFDVLHSLPALESLTLSDSDADDAALAVLAKLDRLTSLHLSGCWHTARATIERIAALPKLRTLRLEHDFYETEWLRALGTMKQLVELRLDTIGLPDFLHAPQTPPMWRPAVNDELLATFSLLHELRVLEIRQSGAKPEGVRRLRELLPELTVRTEVADSEPR